MICDWYSATIPDDIQNVMGYLRTNLGGNFKSAKSGLMGYSNRAYLNDENNTTLATVLWGSPNSEQDNPHAWATSENAQDFMNLVRDVWKENHTVTRIDVAEDMQGDGLFEELSQRLLGLSKQMGVKTSVSGDWLSEGAHDGRTMYLGSKSSACRARLYEKGKQTANDLWLSKGFAPPSDFPMNWVRFELQCRPTKGQQRLLASKADLEDFWGFSKWSAKVAEDIFKLNIPLVSQVNWKDNSDADVLRWVSKQYGKMFLRRLHKLGNWEEVGIELGKYIQQK